MVFNGECLFLNDLNLVSFYFFSRDLVSVIPNFCAKLIDRTDDF